MEEPNGNLSLSRAVGESVVLTAPGGRPVTITVTKVDRNKVRLEFSAPKDVAIFRSELLDRKESKA